MIKELDILKKIAISIVEHFCTKEEPARTNYINKILNTDEFKCINKKLKALEIIKEKRIDTVAFIRCYVTTNKRNEEIVKMYNQICADPFIPFSKRKKTITIEECALLKEVIL